MRSARGYVHDKNLCSSVTQKVNLKIHLFWCDGTRAHERRAQEQSFILLNNDNMLELHRRS